MDGISRVNRGRRNFVAGAAAGALGIAFGARAQGMSKRPVRILLAQTPGTTPDVIARLLAPRLQARRDQPFIVENRPGASGAIGMEAVTKATPDGHTIMVNVATTLTLPYFFPKLPFDVLKSFTPITYIASGNFALTVHQALPVNNVQEFIAYVKARPGQLNYGSPGFGTHHHLCMELLKFSAGTRHRARAVQGLGGRDHRSAGRTDSGDVRADPPGARVPEGRQSHACSAAASASGLRCFPTSPRSPSRACAASTSTRGSRCGRRRACPQILSRATTPRCATYSLNPSCAKMFARQGLVAKPGTPAELMQIARAEHEMWGKLIRAAKIAAPE